MTFQYGAGVGTPSYNQIISFARRSGVAFSVSATTGGSHVSGSYHYSGNAVDLVSSPGEMVRLAEWLYNYYQFELELIHSGGTGFFVKNGVKVDAKFYGASTVSQHYNHVHVAMTQAGVVGAEGAPQGEMTGASTATTVDAVQTAQNKAGGCAWPAASVAVVMLSGFAGIVWEIVRWIS